MSCSFAVTLKRWRLFFIQMEHSVVKMKNFFTNSKVGARHLMKETVSSIHCDVSFEYLRCVVKPQSPETLELFCSLLLGTLVPSLENRYSQDVSIYHFAQATVMFLSASFLLFVFVFVLVAHLFQSSKRCYRLSSWISLYLWQGDFLWLC